MLLFLGAWWQLAWKPFFELEAKPEIEIDAEELSSFGRLRLAVKQFGKVYGKTVLAHVKIIISYAPTTHFHLVQPSEPDTVMSECSAGSGRSELFLLGSPGRFGSLANKKDCRDDTMAEQSAGTSCANEWRWQIMATFESTYHTDWPPVISNLPLPSCCVVLQQSSLEREGERAASGGGIWCCWRWR